MSRSYKKSPYCGDSNSPDMKRFANKKVRNTLDLPNGKAYKKVFCSYDIKDYWSRWTLERALKRWSNEGWYSYKEGRELNREEMISFWKQCCYWK